MEKEDLTEKDNYVVISPSICDPVIKTEVIRLEDMGLQDWCSLEAGEKYTFKIVCRTKRWFNKFPEIN